MTIMFISSKYNTALANVKTVTGKESTLKNPLGGLVFSVDSQETFYGWLNFVMSQIRYIEGVVQKLTKHCPGKAASFKHVASSSNEVPCWSTLKMFLTKLEYR